MATHHITVVDADEQKIKDQAIPLVHPSSATYFAIITSDAHLEECAASIRELNAAIKFIGSVYDLACSEFNRLHKIFTGVRKKSKAPLEEAKRLRTSACIKYMDAKVAAAKLERDKIEDAARKEAEAARVEQAKALEDAGYQADADIVAEAPVSVYVPPPPAAPKPVGVVLTKHWKAKVVDPFVVPRDYLIPDLAAIGRFARYHKVNAVMPGVEFYSE